MDWSSFGEGTVTNTIILGTGRPIRFPPPVMPLIREYTPLPEVLIREINLFYGTPIEGGNNIVIWSRPSKQKEDGMWGNILLGREADLPFGSGNILIGTDPDQVIGDGQIRVGEIDLRALVSEVTCLRQEVSSLRLRLGCLEERWTTTL